MAAQEPADFGRLLRRHRAASGLTQEELAERAGLSARGISDLERGVKTRPHRDTVERLSDALALSPDARAAGKGRMRGALTGGGTGRSPAGLSADVPYRASSYRRTS